MLLLCEAKYWGPIDFFTGRVPCQEQILGSDIFLGEDLLLYGTAWIRGWAYWHTLCRTTNMFYYRLWWRREIQSAKKVKRALLFFQQSSHFLCRLEPERADWRRRFLKSRASTADLLGVQTMWWYGGWNINDRIWNILWRTRLWQVLGKPEILGSFGLNTRYFI